MSGLSITTTGTEAVTRLLDRIPASAEGAQREIVSDLGAAWLAALKAETPIGRGENSPNLIRQYEVGQTYSPQAARYTITNTVGYIGYVVRGRGPIEAGPGRMLRFSIGGTVFFRKRVKASKANNFPARARAKVEGQVRSFKVRLVAAIIRRARA